jgi:mono/diheme cytochrome c family protein
MCQHCHAGPGVERAEWANGMRPRPPRLAEAAVKMSGMPAFGPTHDNGTLWSVTDFVQELPAMTPERYATLGTEARAAAEGGGALRPQAAGAGRTD